MSSHRPSGAPSAAPNGRAAAELARERGAVLLEALDNRVDGARAHADSTASFAFATAVELGLDPDTCMLVREAARLHEVGKLYVRSALLARTEAELSSRARRELGTHPLAGHRLARGAGVPEPACEWILHTGERFDAVGAIPLGSRIIAAACQYDGLAHRGTRRGAFIALIGAAEGRLDPSVVDALARVIERATNGSGPAA